jgi:hypothetical protein
MVAKIDKKNPTVVANAMAPARQPNRFSDMALAELAAGVGPVTMHWISRKQLSQDRIGGSSLPETPEGLPDAIRRGNRMPGCFGLENPDIVPMFRP